MMQVYHIDDQKWTTISDIPQYRCGADIIQGPLTLIGGVDAVTRKVTGKLSTCVDDYFWEEIYPPMPTPRGEFGVALKDNLLITAGGLCAGAVSTVEVLNTESKQWYSLKSLQLPEPIYSCGMTISSGYVYIGGGMNAAKKPSKSYWRLSWSAVQQSVQSRDNTSSPVTWEKIADSPFISSSLLPNSKLPVLFGGKESDNGQTRSVIFVYDPTQKRWTAVGNISAECTRPCVEPVNSNLVFVCGGFIGNKSCTNKTELLAMCL